MIRAIQIAYYQQAKNPSLPETLQACAHEIDLNVETFIEDLRSLVIESEFSARFNRQEVWMFISYPSLRLVHNDAVFPIAVDYLDYRTMLDEIKTIVSEATHT